MDILCTSGAMDVVSGIAEVVGLFVVLVLILIATYYTTRFIAKQTGNRYQSKNINIIETYKVAPNKYIQIVDVAGHYLVLAVTKENVTMLTEISEDDIHDLPEISDGPTSFSDVMKSVLGKKQNK